MNSYFGRFLILLLGTTLIASLLAFILFQQWQYRVMGVHTQATVVATSSPTGCTKQAKSYTLRFVDTQGTSHTVSTCYSRNNLLHVGDQVALWYLPAQPDHVLLDTGAQSLTQETLGLLGGLCLFGGLTIFTGWRWMQRRAQRQQPNASWGQTPRR